MIIIKPFQFLFLTGENAMPRTKWFTNESRQISKKDRMRRRRDEFLYIVQRKSEYNINNLLWYIY